MKPIDNFEFNEILFEIRNIIESKFVKVEYTHVYHEFMSSGRVWWKKIAEKRKEKCKLHSMARAGNVKKKSLSHTGVSSSYTCNHGVFWC